MRSAHSGTLRRAIATTIGATPSNSVESASALDPCRGQSPRSLTSRKRTSMTSQRNSTTGLDKHSDGAHHHKHSTRRCVRPLNPRTIGTRMPRRAVGHSVDLGCGGAGRCRCCVQTLGYGKRGSRRLHSAGDRRGSDSAVVGMPAARREHGTDRGALIGGNTARWWWAATIERRVHRGWSRLRMVLSHVTSRTAAAELTRTGRVAVTSRALPVNPPGPQKRRRRARGCHLRECLEDPRPVALSATGISVPLFRALSAPRRQLAGRRLQSSPSRQSRIQVTGCQVLRPRVEVRSRMQVRDVLSRGRFDRDGVVIRRA
jgi:hypothetical protein